MSLARLAMRLAAARALTGTTIAEDRVFDSAVDPINQAISKNRQPLLIVTTDEHELVVTGRDMASGNHQCDLVIELVIAAAVDVPADDGQGGQITMAIPHTDEGMELLLDMLEHQVVACLTKPGEAWAEVWKALVPSVTKRLSRRGASAENGLRFAARQVVLTCDLLDTPLNTAEISEGTAWGKLLAAMDSDATLSAVANMLRAEIDNLGSSDWRVAVQEMGISLDALDMIGIAPALDEAGDPVPLDTVLVDEAGSTTTIDTASADEQGV